MNKMTVSPWLMVSPDGPLTYARGGQLVHLRQGGLDGACGPYSVVMALITLGVMGYGEARNMYLWHGNSREGRFRSEIRSLGALVSEGTDHKDMLRLVECFSGVGVGAEYVTGSKKDIVQQVQDSIDCMSAPIIGVRWPGGSGHWMMVVGYQGYENEGDFQITHLLCLDPGSETPRTSLWNAVIEVFNEDGSSVASGPLPSIHWGYDGKQESCRIEDAILICKA
ncbi:hypothetical protein OGV25_01240 [Pseudomonas sp. P1B16]|jgi:hypothetical protein|uniref:Peptidase C39-like domain-containing protein n=1 Tax=Pseudomonas capeferrum TaxID=1495066 RepID=A0ABY7RA80_9PSED|nr:MULTISPECIES: hypothetical protein [Pseudomonas]KEY85017.1 hypothetical protein PC358_24785 [Pseudomonas capeferrum]KGI91379.1 hypothetical protein MD26_20920 [Pseudomonas sp. H2]MBC3482065.1 hypothetical protein [Pseudomonas sp. SWRI77]MBC3503192.1 hypothetical protein [Pseudomonas sp. SWRI59]MBC3508609.1 hypothetical protein [Pseudomonas sp. SWRI68]